MGFGLVDEHVGCWHVRSVGEVPDTAVDFEQLGSAPREPARI